VGDRGVLLSGGERQRIAIARAFLKDAPLLLLDEPTSALDAATEARIQRALDSLVKDRTVLTIAHRLATIREADFIVVLHQGSVAEVGSREELLKMKGLFHQAWSRQMEGDSKIVDSETVV
jgi:ATP-binding cassette subfamily B protein